MTFGLAFLLVIVAIYLLFIRGWLFKIILFFAGILGLYVGLMAWVPDTRTVAFTTSGGTTHTWAFVITAIVCLCALATTKSE